MDIGEQEKELKGEITISKDALDKVEGIAVQNVVLHRSPDLLLLVQYSEII
jgi:hypothetical protein